MQIARLKGHFMTESDQAQKKDIILDSINEGVFTVDSKWRVTSFNRAAEQIIGIQR
jgi:sensor histidine kinase regulating citrate/malate metabolism